MFYLNNYINHCNDMLILKFMTIVNFKQIGKGATGEWKSCKMFNSSSVLKVQSVSIKDSSSFEEKFCT